MQKSTYDLVGSEIGRIKVVGVLGEGGMGSVYEGRDHTLQRSVAVKALREEFQLQKESKARFLREARILSKLDHPNICTVHDYLEEGESDYLVMELVEGQNLRKTLKKGLPYSEKLSIARQLLEVLVAVHGKGVIHRDLKPENVMITEDGTVKVLDFGLSRSASEDWLSSTAITLGPNDQLPIPLEDAGHSDSVYVKTKRGTVLGTIGYMSPEQARGEQATAASDMYSLGLVLQELFTEMPPFAKGLSIEKLLSRASEGDTEHIVGLASNLSQLLNRMKAPQPGMRPSATDALEMLSRFVDKPKRRRRLVVLAGVSAILIALGVGLVVQSGKANREKVRAERFDREAEDSFFRSAANSALLSELFPIKTGSERAAAADYTYETLHAAAKKAEQSHGSRREIVGYIWQTVGSYYEFFGLIPEATDAYERAGEAFQAAGNDDRERLLRHLQMLARFYHEHVGDYEKAISYWLKTLPDVNSDDFDSARYAVNAYQGIGRAKTAQRKFEQAEEAFDRAVKIVRDCGFEKTPFFADALDEYARVYWAKRDFGEVRKLLTEAVSLLPEDRLRTANIQFDLGVAVFYDGDRSEGENICRKALQMAEAARGTNHFEMIKMEIRYSGLLRNGRKFDEAIEVLNECIVKIEELGQETDPLMGRALRFLGYAYRDSGQPEMAFSAAERAIEVYGQSYGSDHVFIARLLNNLAWEKHEHGRTVEAEILARRAIEIIDNYPGGESFESINPSNAEGVARYSHTLGEILRCQGKIADALPILERSVSLAESVADRGAVAEIYESYLLVLEAQGETEQAAAVRQQLALLRAEMSETGS